MKVVVFFTLKAKILLYQRNRPPYLMIDVAEKKALELGSRFIHLDVRETQEAAIKLFELKGYKKWGINPYYAFVDGKNLKGHYFFKKLK